MRTATRLGLLIVLAASGALLAATPAFAQAVQTAESTQTGTCFDQATADCGGWSSTTPGTAGRPYVKYLAVENAGATTVVIDNVAAGAQTPTPAPGTDLYAVVATQNACKTGQAAAPGVCYDPPNRVAVYLEHSIPGGWSTDFTSSTSTNPATTTSSVIDLVIGFHSAYSSLRWSWVNGVPSFWNDTIPATGGDGQVEVRFSPKLVPVMNSGGCTQIPVATCDIAQSDGEKLQPQLLLSMDTTLNAGLTGALFGTENAFIGSLDMTPAPPGGTATLTYGIAAPHLMPDGSPRTGALYAILSSPMLTLLGTSVPAFDPAILTVTRTGDPGTSSSAWTGWTAAANGTDGEFLAITGISFSAPKFVVRNKTGKRQPTVKAKRTITLKALASGFGFPYRKGAKLSTRVSTPRICRAQGAAIRGLKPGMCRAVLIATPKQGRATRKSVSFAVVV
ncbi:MAG: hypothetical protein ACR2JV_05340 [Gaiellales bacterium]